MKHTKNDHPAYTEAHAALFQALGELASGLDASSHHKSDCPVRAAMVAALGHIGAAQNALRVVDHVVDHEVDGLTMAAAAVHGGAS